MDNLIKTLPAILRASAASEDVVEAACLAAWKQVVGEGLVNHAVAVEVHHKKLVVVVEDRMWQRQLEQMRAQLLFRLNSLLGQPLVKAIELRVDPKLLNEKRRAREGSTKLPADQKIPEELVTAAAGIQDASLRRAFLGAAASCVRRIEGEY
jgi:hypothetical protein